MDNKRYEYTFDTTSLFSQDEAETDCDEREYQTNLVPLEEAYQLDILQLINKRRKTSSEYLTKSKSRKIVDAEETVNDVNQIFEDITSTLQKLLVDISLLERSELTHDIDSNWEDLNEISDYAIDACDRSFGKPMVLSAPFEYRLGNQVGRILASLTGKPKKDPRAASFYAGLSHAYGNNDGGEYLRMSNSSPKEYTKSNDSEVDSVFKSPPEIHIDNLLKIIDYPDRSELNDQGPKRTISIPLRDSANPLSPRTKDFIRMHGYDMDMEVVNMASAHYNPRPDIAFRRDEKELHDDVVTLLEDEVGRWFDMCVEIRSELDKEWNEIDKASASGLPAKQALSELWDLTIGEDRVSAESDQIAKSYKKSSYEKQVSTVFNSLSYQTKTNHSQADKQLVHDTAVVTYDQGWKLTPYGYLLCFYELHAGDTDMGKVALDEIEMMREDNVLGKSVEFDRELVRQGLEQFYDMDVPKHF